MTETRWWRFVEATLDGMSALEAGRRAGFDSSAFTRWKRGARPDVAFVVKFARAFGLNVVQALAEAEFITDDEAGTREVQVNPRAALRLASDVDIVDEVQRRIQDGSEHRAIDAPLGQPLPVIEDHPDVLTGPAIVTTHQGEQQAAAESRGRAGSHRTQPGR